MSACRKCNNTNIVLNGVWKQCANCGEVHERQSVVVRNPMTKGLSKENNSLNDIVSLSFKSTLMGKLISRLHLIK